MSAGEAAPAYWLSALAEECLELLDRGMQMTMQERVKEEAARHGITANSLAKGIAREWDRIGFVTGARRSLVS